MAADLPVLRSHLYAPGNNPRLLEKVCLAGADAVVLDLEDAVPLAEKSQARELVAHAVRKRAEHTWPAVFVRINHPASGLAEDDVAAVVQPGLIGLRLPKVENAETVHHVAAWLEQAEVKAGLAPGRISLICIIESASGVLCAGEIAVAHPRVHALAYGETDLLRDLGIAPGGDGLETLYARSRLVLASRAAGVRPPVDTVYTHLDDLQGFEQATLRGRALGFFGKSAIHPRQVDLINEIYTPSEAEVLRAWRMVEAAEAAEVQGMGALRVDGEFVDLAVVRRAKDVLRLANQLGKSVGVVCASQAVRQEESRLEDG